jgi:hypothetical protein
MATFITIGYGDEAGYAATDPAVRDRAHAHDSRLQALGARLGRAGTPVQIRNTEGAGVDRREGPFLRADLPIAGFGIVEADSLEEAVAMAAGTPCAVAHGVVEVWPLET